MKEVGLRKAERRKAGWHWVESENETLTRYSGELKMLLRDTVSFDWLVSVVNSSMRNFTFKENYEMEISKTTVGVLQRQSTNLDGLVCVGSSLGEVDVVQQELDVDHIGIGQVGRDDLRQIAIVSE